MLCSSSRILVIYERIGGSLELHKREYYDMARIIKVKSANATPFNSFHGKSFMNSSVYWKNYEKKY